MSVLIMFFIRLSDNGISVFGGASSSSMGRPTFAGRIQNVTVNVGKEAVLACPVNHIGKYKVRGKLAQSAKKFTKPAATSALNRIFLVSQLRWGG